MENMPLKSGRRVKKIILIILGVILCLIIGSAGCLLVVNKFLEAPEWSSCSPSWECKSGLKCLGKICSSGKKGSYCESKTDCVTSYCVNNVCREDIKVSVFVDEEPYNPNNLKKIKIATITVGMSDGNLTVETLVKDDTFNLERLNKALVEIKKRPTLKLTGENERMIDGKQALVMEAWEVAKNNPDYAYAVRETLTMEFGLKAEVER